MTTSKMHTQNSGSPAHPERTPSSAPLIVLQPSFPPSQQPTLPRPILNGTSLSPLVALEKSSSAKAILRPSPTRSFQSSRQSTIKCVDPQGLSFSLSLGNLSLHHLEPSSLGTAKPRHGLYLDFEKIKIDELEIEVCFKCGGEKDKSGVELEDFAEWGRQWICKGECGSEGKIGENGSGQRALGQGEGGTR